jgi:hypothetical protein
MVCWSVFTSLLGSLYFFRVLYIKNDRYYAACDIHIPGLSVKQKNIKKTVISAALGTPLNKSQ